MSKWIRQPQEQEGTYMFTGHFLVTAMVRANLSDQEIQSIYLETQQAVNENNGLDYLQVFVNSETGEKLFFIASATREEVDSGEFDPKDIDYHNCVLCYPEER